MQKIVSISLSLLLIAQVFNPVYQIVYYQVNKVFIAEVLCINQDKPKLNCNGKCYLAKKLKAQSEQEEEHQNVPRENHFNIDYVLTDNVAIGVVIPIKVMHTPVINSLHTSDSLCRLFRPPQLS